jgi:hypothetical protein
VLDLPYDNLGLIVKATVLIFLAAGAFRAGAVRFSQTEVLAQYLSRMWFLPRLRTKFLSFNLLTLGNNVYKY